MNQKTKDKNIIEPHQRQLSQLFFFCSVTYKMINMLIGLNYNQYSIWQVLLLLIGLKHTFTCMDIIKILPILP